MVGIARVVRTRDEAELDTIAEPAVQAVIFDPEPPPRWLGDVAAAVESGELAVPRTVLEDVARDDVARWLAHHLPSTPLGDALAADVLALVDRQARTTGASRFMVRFVNGTPDRHCGFHVDTVPPAAPPWGLLRVYCGAGTSYVAPEAVSSARAFYQYLGRRERLVRELDGGDAAAYDRLVELDDTLAFAPSRAIEVAEAGTIVAFKHLDVRSHWGDHDATLAWIHCSPMTGGPRFLVNVTSHRPARGASAR